VNCIDFTSSIELTLTFTPLLASFASASST